MFEVLPGNLYGEYSAQVWKNPFNSGTARIWIVAFAMPGSLVASLIVFVMPGAVLVGGSSGLIQQGDIGFAPPIGPARSTTSPSAAMISPQIRSLTILKEVPVRMSRFATASQAT
ncbi:MAG: hypothetical protein AAF483_27375 [Planctomycetota bacterium]